MVTNWKHWRATGLAVLAAVALCGASCAADRELRSVDGDSASQLDDVFWPAVYVVPFDGGFVALGGQSAASDGSDTETGRGTVRIEAKAYWVVNGELESVGELPVGKDRAFIASGGVAHGGTLIVAGLSCVSNQTDVPGCQPGTEKSLFLRGDVRTREWEEVDPPPGFTAGKAMSLSVVDDHVLLAMSGRTEPMTSFDLSGQQWTMVQLDLDSMRWTPVASPPPVSDGIAAVMPQMCSTGSVLLGVSPAHDGAAMVATWAPGADAWSQGARLEDREGAFPPVPACGRDRVALMIPERQSSLIQVLDVTDQTLGEPADLVTVPELPTGVRVAVSAEGSVIVATQRTVDLYPAEGGEPISVDVGASQVRRMIRSGDDLLIHSSSGVVTVDGGTGEIVQRV